MAYSCDVCGHKSSEIKQGGGISEKATKLTFNFQTEEDLCRDVFKSDTCETIIPELDMTLAPGTLGSMYTTVEGLISKTIENMEKVNPFGKGDSKEGTAWLEFIEKLKIYKQG